MLTMRGEGRWLTETRSWKRNYFILICLQIGNPEQYILDYEKYPRKPVASEITDVW